MAQMYLASPPGQPPQPQQYGRHDGLHMRQQGNVGDGNGGDHGKWRDANGMAGVLTPGMPMIISD